MHILIISAMYGVPWGGSEELWYKMALLYLKKNYKVNVISPYWKEVPIKHKELSALGVNFYYVLNPIRFKLLYKILKKLFPNFFNIRNEYSEIIQKLSPDCIIVSQGHVFSAVAHKQLYYALMNSNSLIYLISQYNTELTVLDVMEINFIRALHDKCKIWFFVSNHNLILAEHQLASKLTKAKVLYNLPSFNSSELISFPPLDVIRFSMVSRLDVVDKGQDILFKVLSTDKWKLRKWELYLYGSGKDEEYLRQLAVFYNIVDRVFFMGNVSDIKETWKFNHILLMPSRAEGIPLSLVEAFTVGRPAVVTDVGGNSEWVSEGTNGFIADAPTPKLFDQAMERMWSSRDRLQELGQNAFSFAMSKIPDMTKSIDFL